MAIDLESVSEATSGAIGALLSTTLLYPLDTCKTKYQAEVRVQGHQKYRHLTDVLWEAVSSNQILSLYQGLGTKNLQSFIAQFIYFYGYSYFKRLYLEKSGAKSIGTRANLVVAAAAGACTAIVTQPLDTAASRMQTSAFGKSKGLWETLSAGSWSEAFDGLSISLLLTSNPAIQDLKTGKVLGRGRRQGWLFLLEFDKMVTPTSCFFSATLVDVSRANKIWKLWYTRLGHPHEDSLFHFFSNDLLSEKL